MSPVGQLRALESSDMQEVVRVQTAAFAPSLTEPPEALLCKINGFPRGAWGCFCEEELAGYIICVPWKGEKALPLGDTKVIPPEQADHLYIHDLAVHPDHRGKGVATRLVTQAIELARKTRSSRIALTSVQGSQKFWAGWGVRSKKKFEYAPGAPAVYMVRERGSHA